MSIGLETRFNSKINRFGENECWLWTGARDRCGYGQIKVGEKAVQAHRVSWEMHNAEVPKGLCVLHRCDNPPCVNPKHLFLGTKKDNAVDAFSKGRRNVSTHCRRGHLMSGSNLELYPRKDGWFTRQCAACHRQDERERYHRNKESK